ncbi:MAG: glycosyl hydrolase family 18 protein [Ferrimonas sp.]
MKRNALKLAIALGLSTLSGSALAMTNPAGGVVVGYWHNWCDGAGYQGGNAPCVTLDAVNPMYNVVNVSFMKVFNLADGRIPTFYLDPNIGLSEAEFIAQIARLNQQGRAVLISLGGADAHIELKNGDEFALADEIIRLTDRYGFDGLDIDLEQAAVTASDNQTVIPAALRIVKDHYRTQGKNFLITMAPEFPYLTSGGKYVPYIENLEGYYDWINPQFYNQGGDGIWIDNLGWVAQNNNNLKQEFIYYISDSLINGTRGFHKIPHDKLVFGIPSSNDAAATGFVNNPQHLYNAFNQLTQQGQPLRGVMTWSINWDMGTNAAGQPYNEQFIKDYGSFIHGQTILPPVESNNKPTFTGIGNARVAHGSAFDAMAGVAANDQEDGDLTHSILVEGDVNVQQIGTYILTYRVTDSDGNETVQARSVEVYSQKPVFSGVADATVTLGSTFDPMAGVSAQDAEDGNLTSKILVLGSVNTSVAGRYTLQYSVTDSANQTVQISRVITVTDGSTCANGWSASEVYLQGDEVSYNGALWQAGWWTRGDAPGSTGEWGVWRKVGDADQCGGNENGDSLLPEVEFEPTMTITGLQTEYVLINDSVNVQFTVNTNEQLDVSAIITDAYGQIIADTQILVDGSKAASLELSFVEAGRYQLNLQANASNGAELKVSSSFTVTVKNEVAPGDYPQYQAGQAYNAGDIVVGSDNNLYECKPWPYTGWCASPSYAPASSLYWADAWNKI